MILGDADERVCMETSVAQAVKLETRVRFVAGPDGTYYTCKAELWNPRSGQWVPITPLNIGDALKGEL